MLGLLLHSHISLLEQSRFGLDSQVEWCEQDQEFVYEVFYRNLMQLFEDEEWAAETIEWYNVCVHPFSSTLLMLIAFSEVFGPGHHDDSGRLLAGPSSLSMIANSRVRRARGTTDAPTAPSTSSTGPSASTSGDTSSASPAAGDTSSASGAAGDHAPTSGSTPVSTDGSPLVDAPSLPLPCPRLSLVHPAPPRTPLRLLPPHLSLRLLSLLFPLHPSLPPLSLLLLRPPTPPRPRTTLHNLALALPPPCLMTLLRYVAVHACMTYTHNRYSSLCLCARSPPCVDHTVVC